MTTTPTDLDLMSASRWRGVARVISDHNGSPLVEQATLDCITDALVVLVNATEASTIDKAIDLLGSKASSMAPAYYELAADASGDVIDLDKLSKRKRGVVALVRMAVFLNGHPRYVELDDQRRHNWKESN